MRPFRAFLLLSALVLPATSRSAHADGVWGQGAAAATTGDCDPGVQAHQDQAMRAAVDAYAALANANYTPLPTGGFRTSSCLDQLLNNGLNVLFNPPNLDTILAALAEEACQYATTMISSEAYKLLDTNGTMGLPLGQIVPGLSLGNFGGGFSVSPSIGGVAGGGINVQGANAVTGNLNGYWGGTPYPADSYGSLFGSASGDGTTSSGSGGWFSGLFGGQ